MFLLAVYARHGSDAVPGEHERPGAFKSQSNLRANRSKCCWITEDLPLLTQMPISCNFSLHLQHSLSLAPSHFSLNTNTSHWRIIQERFETQIYSQPRSFSATDVHAQALFPSVSRSRSIVNSEYSAQDAPWPDWWSVWFRWTWWMIWVLSLRRKAKQNDNSW